MDLRPDGKICHRKISGNGFCEQPSYKSIKATSIFTEAAFCILYYFLKREPDELAFRPGVSFFIFLLHSSVISYSI